MTVSDQYVSGRIVGNADMHKDIMRLLDTYGAPPGDTIEERLRAWSEITRSLHREIHALRRFGNKDCTAMADDWLDKTVGCNDPSADARSIFSAATLVSEYGEMGISGAVSSTAPSIPEIP